MEELSRFKIPEPPQGWKIIVSLAPLVILLLAGLYVVFQGFYTVMPYEEAVVLRCGKYLSTQGPGLHFKVPVIDEAIRVEVAEHSMRLPYGIRTNDRGDEFVDRSRQDESLILTGDLYAGVVEWNVIWRVSEPDKYLFSIARDDVEDTITAVARSTMHRVVGDHSADEILTGKREEVGQLALDELRNTLDRYECGVSIIDLQMQRVIPPQRVRASFDDVNASIQHRDQLVNEAQKEWNKLIPQAEAAQDKLIREAEGYAARRRAEADGEISALLAKYRAYKEAPEVTRQRLYLDAMEQVMSTSGPKIILDDELKGLLPLLNLNTDSPSSPRGTP